MTVKISIQHVQKSFRIKRNLGQLKEMPSHCLLFGTSTSR